MDYNLQKFLEDRTKFKTIVDYFSLIEDYIGNISSLEDIVNTEKVFVEKILGYTFAGNVQDVAFVREDKYYLNKLNNKYYIYKIAAGEQLDGAWLDTTDDHWVELNIKNIKKIMYDYGKDNLDITSLSEDIDGLASQVNNMKNYIDNVKPVVDDVVGKLSTLLLYMNPPGTIITGYFPDNLIIPGYIDVDGVLLNKNTYSKLFEIFGYKFGGGRDYFKLIDVRGEFLRYFDGGRAIDVGRIMGSYQAQQLLEHTHIGTTSTNGLHTHAFNRSVVSDADKDGNFDYGRSSSANAHDADYYYQDLINPDGAHNHTFTTDITGSAENRVRNIALRAKIRV